MEVGDLAVERHAGLQDDVGAALAHGGQKDPVLALRLGDSHARDHLDTRLAELGEALARHERVGVADRRDHASHTCGDESVSARRRPTVMGAGLESHVDRRAPGPPAGHL